MSSETLKNRPGIRSWYGAWTGRAPNLPGPGSPVLAVRGEQCFPAVLPVRFVLGQSMDFISIDSKI